TRTAAVPPATARPAAEAPDTRSGGFVVQLSSQRSESEALASFRSLQAKFPDELSTRQPIVRRVDLGSKGVFYRTMVGPFASLHQAAQFCASYKAAGGQCVVPSN
ncbi:MAG: SPOR domain-containing protein, partial [Xanthobacteraceae bacterium]